MKEKLTPSHVLRNCYNKGGLFGLTFFLATSLVLILFSNLAQASAPVEATYLWETYTVARYSDEYSVSFVHIDMDIDLNNDPHLAYNFHWLDNLSIRPVFYASGQPGNWYTATVITDSANIGQAIALDANGVPTVLYTEDTTPPDPNEVLLAQPGGSGLPWVTTTITYSMALFPELYLGNDGKLHLFAMNYYGNQTESGWQFEALSPEGVKLSGAIDSENEPHALLRQYPIEGPFTYTTKILDTWQSMAVPIPTDARWADMALDSNTYPHIAYTTGGTVYEMRYVHWDGTEWHTETVSSDVFDQYDITVDAEDAPHIIFYQAGSGLVGLIHAYRMGTDAWGLETIDATALPYEAVMKANDTGNIHVAYLTGLYDSYEHEIRYARGLSPMNFSFKLYLPVILVED